MCNKFINFFLKIITGILLISSFSSCGNNRLENPIYKPEVITQQVKPTEDKYIYNDTNIYSVDEVDEWPRFPGCEGISEVIKKIENCAKAKMLRFIYMSLKYPAIARENSTQGMVLVQFVVYADGEISDIMIVKDIGYECGEAVITVIQSMNEMEEYWIPGTIDGEPVNVLYVLPVKFQLEG